MSQKAYEDACTRAELFGQPLPDKEEFMEKNKHLDVVEFEEVEIKTAENTAMLEESLREAKGGLEELNTLLSTTQTKINKLKPGMPMPMVAELSDPMINYPSSSTTPNRNSNENIVPLPRMSMLVDNSEPMINFPSSSTIPNQKSNEIIDPMGVCGSLTNFFRVKMNAKDNLSYSSDPSYVGQTNYDKDYVPTTDVEAGTTNEDLGPNDNELMPKAGRSQNDGSSGNAGGGGITGGLSDLERMQKIQDESIFGKGAVRDVKNQVELQINKLDKIILQADRAQSCLQSQNKDLRNLKR